MRGDECHGQAKLVPSTRNKPMHNARNKSKVKTLGERLLKVKSVNLQSKNDTRLGDDESKDIERAKSMETDIRLISVRREHANVIKT